MSDTPRDLELAATLARVEDKLDRVLAAQRWTDDLIAEMTPVAREVIRAGGVTLGDLEARGYFAVGAELLALVDRVIAAYGPGEVRQLAEHVVAILDTVRHLTQPDLLAAVNEAGDLVQRADEVRPVGVFGAVAATRDEEVQRGLGVAVELLRHLGRRREGVAAPPAARPAPTASVPPAAPPAPAASAPAASAPVVWEGRAFSPDGFLVDPATWDEALAARMAESLGVPLTDEHWQVLRWVREDFLAHGASPNVRRVAAGSGVGVRRMYDLFPKTPGKTAAMIAGVPKPVGCV